MEFSVNQIATILDGKVEGNGEAKVSTFYKIQEGKPGGISFLANQKYESFLYETNATAVIVSSDFEPKKEVKATLIRVDDPYSGFTKLLEEYNKLTSSAKTGVESPSFVSDSAQIGENIYRGAFSYIGEKVKIGNNVKVYPNAFIGDNVVIGDNTTIYAGVKIYNDSKIGKNCVIHAGAVIGSDGFGFAPQEDGTYKTIPQLGNVIIEDNVDIGANTVIDCATMGSTVVKQGVKLDNLIQIAHNAEIGENTVIAAQTGVSGSTKLGKNCVVAGQVGIVGHLEIADRVTLAAQAGVSRSIKQEGAVWFGTPAYNHKDFLKAYAVFRNLPDLSQRLRQLEENVLNLRAK